MAKQGAPKAEEMAKKGLEDRITQAPKRNFSSVDVAFGGYCKNAMHDRQIDVVRSFVCTATLCLSYEGEPSRRI